MLSGRVCGGVRGGGDGGLMVVEVLGICVCHGCVWLSLCRQLIMEE